jgi:4-amino-4-deoxy-L-arabinose transferase-like glycosyltransferase
MAMPPTASSATRREVAILFLATFLAASANIRALPLPALDDCFYARKGVEMARSGGFYTVTWNGSPTFQNPPLVPWLLARSFSAFGENDVAARLPSLVMALGLVLAAARLGKRLSGGPEAATGVALLVASPLFMNHARRCMMEVPLAFFVTVSMLVLVEGLARPGLLLLFALPLGGALLTKSLLGLLPLFLAAVAAALSAPFRRAVLSLRFLLGAVGGLALGASWPIQQALTLGPGAVRAHFVGEILSRSLESGRPWGILLDYPTALLLSFQPAVLPGLAGAWLLIRRWRSAPEDAAVLLPLWAVGPVLLYSFSQARSPRYIFPVLPALALCGGVWLAARFPRTARVLRAAVVPGLLAIAAVIFWTRPSLLVKVGTAPFKAAIIQARVPTGEPVTYFGTRYWGFANPLLYYGERWLEFSRPSVSDAIAVARSRRSGVLLVDRDRLEELAGTGYSIVAEGSEWLLLDLAGPGRR